METVAPWSCVICQGASGKPRASPRSQRCTSNKKPWRCRDALTAVLEKERATLSHQMEVSSKRAREALEEQSSAYAAIILAKQCFAIDEVCGVCYFDCAKLCGPDGERKQRTGVEEAEYDYQYLIRGGFGDDRDDSLIPGTRWVSLTELFNNCSVADLDMLDAFDTANKERTSAARKLKWEATMEDAHEEEEEAM